MRSNRHSANARLDYPETMSRALRTIAHRGPDRTSHWFSDRTGLALGHIRLSIIGLNNGEAAKIPFQTR